VSVLGKIYASHFRSYLSSMERMQHAVASQADVIGVADAPAVHVNNVLSLFGKAQVGREPYHTGRRGGRLEVPGGLGGWRQGRAPVLRWP
jgi:hypothetical protein